MGTRRLSHSLHIGVASDEGVQYSGGVLYWRCC